MSITIHRNTGLYGAGGYMKIKVDGKVEKLKLEEPNEIVLSKETAKLEINQFGTKRIELEVYDGDIIEISNRKWLTWMTFLLPLFTVLLVPSQLLFYFLGFWLFLIIIYSYSAGFYKVAVLDSQTFHN